MKMSTAEYLRKIQLWHHEFWLLSSRLLKQMTDGAEQQTVSAAKTTPGTELRITQDNLKDTEWHNCQTVHLVTDNVSTKDRVICWTSIMWVSASTLLQSLEQFHLRLTVKSHSVQQAWETGFHCGYFSSTLPCYGDLSETNRSPVQSQPCSITFSSHPLWRVTWLETFSWLNDGSAGMSNAATQRTHQVLRVDVDLESSLTPRFNVSENKKGSKLIGHCAWNTCSKCFVSFLCVIWFNDM